MSFLLRLSPFVTSALLLFASGCKQTPADIEKHLQERRIAAKPGAGIELPEGKLHFTRTLSLTSAM